MIYVLAGLSGTGKSSVARDIAETTGAEVLRSDVIRQEMPPMGREERYGHDAICAVYIELTRRAMMHAAAGRSVVLDATFHAEMFRAHVRAEAAKLGISTVFLHIACPDTEAERRITERLRRGGDASEATIEIRRQQALEWQPITDEHIVIDTSGSLNETTRLVREALQALAEKSPKK